jgi:hypothetical protein
VGDLGFAVLGGSVGDDRLWVGADGLSNFHGRRAVLSADARAALS